ncbi:MAG: hypothetical protein HYY35_08810 [Deltaproteobacteria bacterium]|nr:hypothetical protein [Deltaproteobacteria bacterium]
MRRRNLDPLGAVLLALVLAAGCGGGSGGRAPTVVSGNVRSAVAAATAARGLERLWRMVRAWWSGEAVAQVPGIAVAIEGTSNSASTDERGFFRLEGNQFGPAVLHFSGSGTDARYPLTLPSGGEVDLVNVDLSGSEITVGEHRIHFEGPITGIDCRAALLQVLSGEQVAFRVRLQPATSIVDPNGASIGCADLVIGRSADVQGTVNDNGDVLAVQLRLSPDPAATAPSQTVQGTITALDCPTNLTVSSPQGNVQVNLSASTAIRDSNGASLSCGDLLVGDAVEVDGADTGFGIAASQVERLAPTPAPTPTTP